MLLGGERGAFYRIFFRHEYRIRVIEGDIRCGVAVMIREGMRGALQAEVFKMGEEALRMTDARDSVQTLPRKIAG